MTIESDLFKEKPSEFDSCYRFEIRECQLKDFFRGVLSDFTRAPHEVIKLVDSCTSWVLFGYVIFVSGGDPYDEPFPVAIASSIEELQIFADIHGLNCVEVNTAKQH